MYRMPLLASFLVVLLFETSLPLLSHGATYHHQAAPPPVTLPITPHPDACVIEPRDEAEFLALLGTPSVDEQQGQARAPEPTIVPVPVGSPADGDVRDAISATVHELYACFNSGDVLRAFALLTDQYLEGFAANQALTPEDVAFFLEDPAPPPLMAQTRVLAVTDISVLADGRVGAFIVTDQELSGTDTAYTVFSQQEGRWLIDESIQFL